MSIKIEGGDWESCKNMIYKLSLERFNLMKNKRPDVEFDDVLSEAYCIYAQCLVTYKGDKGMKFSTFLYTNLRARLLDFYLFSVKQLFHYEDYNYVDKDGSVKRFEEDLVTDYDIDKSTKDLIQLAKEELSYEAYRSFEYIINREWEAGNRRAFPTNAKLAKALGYNVQIMDSIMLEIKQFCWKNMNWQIFDVA